MKKILSLVLAIMMVLSMANVAFAAPEDVTDKNQIKAVDALTALGIVKGYDDGSYKPEKVVTRAELAKMLVEALGQGNLVAGSESSFKDAKGKWYDGYVALASGLELVTGYPDGTFKGENPVSYQEAVVMILRSLGYTNSTVNNGVNAYNATRYKTLAQSLGILTNVTFLAGGANRGDIASMVYNALEVDRVEPNEKGLPQKIVIGKELVQVPNSNPAVYKEEPVYETLLDKLTTKEIVAVTPNSLDPTNRAYLGNLVDLEPYMYQNIVAYLNDDDHVMFVKGSQSPTVKGTVSAMRSTDIQWINDNNGNKVKDKVLVTKSDKVVERVQWNATATINVFYNGGEYQNAPLGEFHRWSGLAGGVPGANGEFDGAEVTLVLDPVTRVVVAAVARTSNESRQVSAAYKKDATVLSIKRTVSGVTSASVINLPKAANGKVDLTKVVVKGEVTSIEDIVAGDVVTAYYAAGDAQAPTKIELVVCRDTIEGKVTKIDVNGYRVIDGEAYYTVGGVVGLGDEGEFFLDADGSIVGFTGKSMSNANYALITDLQSGLLATTNNGPTLIKDAYIKLLNKEGKTTTYNFTTTAKYVITSPTGVKGTETDVFTVANRQDQVLNVPFGTQGDYQYVVTGFNTDENGKITLIGLKQLVRNNVIPTSKVFAAADNVVIFSAYHDPNGVAGDNTFAIAKVADLRTTGVTPNYYSALNAKGEFELIIANEQLIRTDSYAIITSVEDELINSGRVQNVTAYVKGEKVVFQTAVGVTMGSGLGGRLFRLPLSNGVISSTVTTGSAMDMDVTNQPTSPFAPVMTTTTSPVNGTITTNEMRLAKGATIYVYTQSLATGGYSFTRVGDESDLSLSNSLYKFYDLDNDMSNGYEVVIINVMTR